MSQEFAQPKKEELQLTRKKAINTKQWIFQAEKSVFFRWCHFDCVWLWGGVVEFECFLMVGSVRTKLLWCGFRMAQRGK